MIDLAVRQAPIEPAPVSNAERLFLLLVSIFITALVLTQLIAGKYFVWLGFPLSCRVLAYPFTFLMVNLIAEIYGAKYARMLILFGLIISILIAGLTWIARQLPIDPGSPIDQATFDQMFDLLPSTVIGSMIAYLLAQLVNLYIFAYLKQLGKQRHLWLANYVAMLMGQLLDTLVVVIMVSILGHPIDGNQQLQPITWELWTTMILGYYLFQALLTLWQTPLLYMAIYLIKSWIGFGSVK